MKTTNGPIQRKMCSDGFTTCQHLLLRIGTKSNWYLCTLTKKRICKAGMFSYGHIFMPTWCPLEESNEP